MADHVRPGIGARSCTPRRRPAAPPRSAEALPGLPASAVDTVRSVRTAHRTAERSGATVVSGHDADAWPVRRRFPGLHD